MRIQVLYCCYALLFFQTIESVSLYWIKKNILDMSPLNMFFDVIPRDRWLDKEGDTKKNMLLSMGAQGIIRAVPTVGTKMKIACCGMCDELLGKKKIWQLGPLRVRSKTLSYYGVNALYSILFAPGTMKQKVLYTLYKLFIRKLSAYHLAHNCCLFGRFVGINGTLVRMTEWWMIKKEYSKVIVDISFKVFKALIEVMIDECIGSLIVPAIYRI